MAEKHDEISREFLTDKIVFLKLFLNDLDLEEYTGRDLILLDMIIDGFRAGLAKITE